MEKTFIMLKPGAIQRNLIGEVIRKIEQKGLKICALKMINVSKEQAYKHYDVHKSKPFFDKLIKSITYSPVIVMVIEGNNVVEITRKLAGSTDPTKAEPGTIRGDFSSDMTLNVIHTADSIERAKKEISIYFSDLEILKYKKSDEKDIFSNNT